MHCTTLYVHVRFNKVVRVDSFSIRLSIEVKTHKYSSVSFLFDHLPNLNQPNEENITIEMITTTTKSIEHVHTNRNMPRNNSKLANKTKQQTLQTYLLGIHTAFWFPLQLLIENTNESNASH